MTMTQKGYMSRLIDAQIPGYLKSVGAICIEGPKGCGKTWTSLNCCKSAIMLDDPAGNFQNFNLVKTDISMAFRGDEPHLVDEWQKVPEIWDAVKFEVDSRHRKGSFVLTGSSTPVHKGVMHSGTGRIGSVKMRTMSLLESGDSDGSVRISSMFDGTFENQYPKKTELEDLIYLAVRGGWPMNLGLDADASAKANGFYVKRAIEDASKTDGKNRDKNKLMMTLKSLARNESTIASVNRIMSDTEASESAVCEYLDVFRRLYLTEDQNAFSPNVRSRMRIGKSPKRHLADPSLAIAALEMDGKSLLNDVETFGFMFESMCERDLDIYASSIGGKLFHFRESNNLEVDSVIELSDGRYGAFEIKLGAGQIDTACDNLVKFRKKMTDAGRGPEFLCVICGMSDAAYRREDGIYVVPITRLSP